MKRTILFISLLTLGLTTLVGCGAKNKGTVAGNQQTQVNTDDSNDNNASDSENQVSITHSKGTVTVPVGAKKAVVFDLGILDTIDALGLDVEVAVPTDSLVSYLSKYETATNAGGIKEPNIEAIFDFDPDVIFISGRQADFYDELSKIAPVVYVDLMPESYMQDFATNVRNVARIFGNEELAKEKIKEIEDKVASVKAVTESSEEKALVLLTNDGNISVYGKGSRFGIVHDVLGVKQADENIEVSTHGQEANYEYISQVNPDIMFVVDRTAVVAGTADAAKTLDNELVNKTNAAKNGKIITLDAECWYLTGGGLTSVDKMVSEVEAAMK